MIYSRPLPKMNNLSGLAIVARPYPKTAGGMLRVARNWKFSHSVANFLKLFPEDEEFTNTQDFMTRCEVLEGMLRDERNMPAENLRSPQD